ncbi:retroviral-like aspartic protease family protein [Vulcanisaeta thermophila]|uniref:retroviral-like aspartic protease family protein n=1 Tax=Vulcanisaeta thermophila TaxID=867917 RepID=UPI000852FFD6|nr:retroviral-like aspartic protease family protein [Vulcanisaeta thermophila]
MGHVYVDVTIYGREPRTVKALVDTGATYTVIPRKLAEELGIRGLGTFVNVLTAKGYARLEEALVTMEIMNERRNQVVLLSDDVDMVIVGVITLESMGFIVDPTTGKLERSGVFLLLAGKGLNT